MEFKDENVLRDSVQPFCAQTTDIAPLFEAEATTMKKRKLKRYNLRVIVENGLSYFLCK